MYVEQDDLPHFYFIRFRSWAAVFGFKKNTLGFASSHSPVVRIQELAMWNNQLQYKRWSNN